MSLRCAPGPRHSLPRSLARLTAAAFIFAGDGGRFSRSQPALRRARARIVTPFDVAITWRARGVGRHPRGASRSPSADLARAHVRRGGTASARGRRISAVRRAEPQKPNSKPPSRQPCRRGRAADGARIRLSLCPCVFSRHDEAAALKDHMGTNGSFFFGTNRSTVTPAAIGVEPSPPASLPRPCRSSASCRAVPRRPSPLRAPGCASSPRRACCACRSPAPGSLRA